MRYILVTILSLIVSFGVSANDQYRFGPEDIISFELWGEADLTRNSANDNALMVRPDGRVTFPLVGDVYVARKTIADVTAEVEEGLKKYFTHPVVTISVEELNSNTIYVIGGVNQPGAYITGADVTILQAITLAGGQAVFGGNDVIVLRRLAVDGDHTNVAVFQRKYSKLVKDPSEDFMLQGGDTVIVEGLPGEV